MELTKKEMNQVTGGAISWGVVAGIAAAIVYLIGCVGGITNPNRCKN